MSNLLKHFQTKPYRCKHECLFVQNHSVAEYLVLSSVERAWTSRIYEHISLFEAQRSTFRPYESSIYYSSSPSGIMSTKKTSYSRLIGLIHKFNCRKLLHTCNTHHQRSILNFDNFFYSGLDCWSSECQQ